MYKRQIFVPNDSVIQSAMPVVTAAAREAKVPVYGSSAVMVDEGAFATVAAVSYTHLLPATLKKLTQKA